MHQSSLGSLMMLAGPKLHPLWLTGWLPLLFLMTCLAMGYAIVVFESVFSSIAFGRKPEIRDAAQPAEDRGLGRIGLRRSSASSISPFSGSLHYATHARSLRHDVLDRERALAAAAG